MSGALPTWWEPTQELIEGSNLNRFRKTLNATFGIKLVTNEDIHAFSVQRLEDFWRTVWEWSGVRHHRKYTTVLSDPSARPGDLPRFFDDARLNLAENL